MRTRIVIQLHPNGQKNISLSSDPTIPIEDLLVNAEGWQEAKVVIGSVIVIGEEDIVQHLTNGEFRSVDNAKQVEVREMLDAQTLPVQNFLDAHFKKETL